MRILAKSALAALAAGCALAALPASANVISIGTTGATLTCSISCQGFIGAGGLSIDPPPPSTIDPTGVGTLSDTTAELYNGSPAEASDEGTRLSTLVGAPVGVGTKFDPPSNPFDSSSLYIVLKIGPHDIFIKNTSGGSQTYTYAQNTATGLGLSHYTEFGGTVIPIPAAIWLMGAGLAGLGFAGRRRKA